MDEISNKKKKKKQNKYLQSHPSLSENILKVFFSNEKMDSSIYMHLKY